MPANVLNFEAFNAEAQAWAKTQPPAVVTAAQRKIMLDVLALTLRKTPVDMGHLRFNWQITVGAPAGSVLAGVDSSKDGQQTHAKGAIQLATLAPYQLVWLTNNSPQVEVVEFGGYEPANPENSPEANARRASRRLPPMRAVAKSLTGDPGGPLVSGGYSIRAPQGMLTVSVQLVVSEFQRDVLGKP